MLNLNKHVYPTHAIGRKLVYPLSISVKNIDNELPLPNMTFAYEDNYNVQHTLIRQKMHCDISTSNKII